MSTDRSEMRRAFIEGYFEGRGKPEELDRHLAMFGFRTTAQEKEASEPAAIERELADYDDSV